MKPAISVVIPLLDERGTLEELHGRLTDVLVGMGEPYEILFVDDGSQDGSAEVLARLADRDPHVGVVRFRRNFGKSAALDAGFQRARGDVIVTMDADLQDEPTEVPRLVATLRERDLDLVSGWKQKRHDPLGKTLPSKLFNFVVRTLTGLKLNDFNCGLKAYRAETVDGLRLYGELHRYVPVLVHDRGFACGEMPVQHNPRKWGRSKYGVERMAKGFFDLLTVILLTRYRRRPLHLFGWAGLVMFALGFACLFYLTVIWFLGSGIGTRPLLDLGLLLVMVGVQLLCTGLLGEMLVATRVEAEPGYVVREERLAESFGVGVESETESESETEAESETESESEAESESEPESETDPKKSAAVVAS